LPERESLADAGSIPATSTIFRVREPGLSPGVLATQNLVFDTGLKELVFAASMKRQIQKLKMGTKTLNPKR
jgi:hypothetical protein